MTRIRRRPRRPALSVAVAATALIASVALSGCSLAQGIVGDVLPEVAVPALPELPGASVPSDFPPDVPLFDGKVTLGVSVPVSGSGGAWNVNVEVPGPEAYDTIVTQMTDAGFDVQEVTAGSSAAFSTATLGVVVVVASGDGTNWTANYSVTEIVP